ncbi:MAG: polyamine aminopropyltransferase [Candidatus Zixiibacteriota bacterium]|nr:MAG: polyamine aminopropyltransferase [candidate division Zixibacteria bacterium]
MSLSSKKRLDVKEKYIVESSMQDLWNVWFTELHLGNSGLTVKVKRLVETAQSRYQRIDVLDTEDFGKMLVLYGSIMVAENDLFSYNEMITHVPLFAHPGPERVLIIGGGDGGALTNVMKHPEVKSATMCEIDRMVVEISTRHFPELSTGFRDKRARIIFRDGRKYIETGRRKFDIILLDLSDPIGPAANLFQKSFHQGVFNRLNDDGIMVAQSESPYYNAETVRQMYDNLREIFPIVKMYSCHVPIYPSCYWTFAFCSKKYHPIVDFDIDRYKKLKLKNNYYNLDVHIGAFALPEYVKKLIGEK